MNAIVVYTSRYGSAEQYARWIADALGCPAKALQRVPARELAQYDTIIYGGGLYAGSIAGFQAFLKKLGTAADKRLLLFMVGMTNPSQKEAYAEIAQRCIPAQWQGRFSVFALRGNQMFSKMSTAHKLMMRIPKAAAQKKPPQERTEDDRLFIEYFGQDVLFVTRSQIEPILQALRE